MWGSVVLCRRQKGSVREKKNCTRHSLLLKVFVSFADQHSLYCEEYVHMYTYLYTVKNMCTCTHTSILWRICAHVHISLYCEEYVHMYTYLSVYRQHNKYLCFQMTLQVKHFYTNRSGAKCSLAVIIGVPAWRWLGEYLTLDRTFYSLRLKQEVVAATGTAIFASLSHSSRPV